MTTLGLMNYVHVIGHHQFVITLPGSCSIASSDGNTGSTAFRNLGKMSLPSLMALKLLKIEDNSFIFKITYEVMTEMVKNRDSFFIFNITCEVIAEIFKNKENFLFLKLLMK